TPFLRLCQDRPAVARKRSGPARRKPRAVNEVPWGGRILETCADSGNEESRRAADGAPGRAAAPRGTGVASARGRPPHGTRDRRLAGQPDPPGPRGPHPDSDARACCDRVAVAARGEIRDPQRTARQVEAVVVPGETERPRDAPGSARQPAIGDGAAAAAH